MMMRRMIMSLALWVFAAALCLFAFDRAVTSASIEKMCEEVPIVQGSTAQEAATEAAPARSTADVRYMEAAGDWATKHPDDLVSTTLASR